MAMLPSALRVEKNRSKVYHVPVRRVTDGYIVVIADSPEQADMIARSKRFSDKRIEGRSPMGEMFQVSGVKPYVGKWDEEDLAINADERSIPGNVLVPAKRKVR